jgi:peptidyl-tRNA hydrolase
MNNENLYLYILMRTDLPSMSVGRAAAQASHAANAFIHKYGRDTDVKKWQNSTEQGFGTAIVLSANIDQIEQVWSLATKENIPNDKVIDPDYVIPVSSEVVEFLDPHNSRITLVEQSQSDPKKYLIHRSEVTCSYIFGDKEKLKTIIGSLSLYS